MVCGVYLCFKQKTAYELRISDWSSDVCSSDLLISSSGTDESNNMGTTMTAASTNAKAPISRRRARPRSSLAWASLDKEVRDVDRRPESEIGRASCRERVCQYV